MFPLIEVLWPGAESLPHLCSYHASIAFVRLHTLKEPLQDTIARDFKVTLLEEKLNMPLEELIPCAA